MTPVGATAFGYMAGLKPAFDTHHTRIIDLNVDPAVNRARWAEDLRKTQGHAVNFAMIGDAEPKVGTLYNTLAESAGDTCDGRKDHDKATVRSVFIIGPDRKIKAMLIDPMQSGRNVDEVLRLLASCQLCARNFAATLVNWHSGDDVIIRTLAFDGPAGLTPPRLENLKTLSAGCAHPEG